MKEQINEAMSSAANLSKIVTGTVVCVLTIYILLGEVALGSNVNKKTSLSKRNKRNVSSSQATQCNDQMMNMPQEYNNSVDASLLRYTPVTPNPEDVNCYVEVPVTRRVGGRCVLLGSRTWGCQAGIFLAFSSECQNVARSQTSTQAQAGDVASTTARTQRPNRVRNPLRRRRPVQP